MMYTRRQLEMMGDRIEACCASQMIGARCTGGKVYPDGTIVFTVVGYTGPRTFGSLPGHFSHELELLLGSSQVAIALSGKDTMTVIAAFQAAERKGK